MPPSLRVLITGGSGFLGQAIVKAVSDQEPQWDVFVLDSRESSIVAPDRFVKADMTDTHELAQAVRRVSPVVIIHSAGIIPQGRARYDKSGAHRESVTQINIEGTRNVVRAARDCGCRALVYTSSCTVITDDQDHDYANMNEKLPMGNATLDYGWSKTAAERLVLAANDGVLSTCALRPSTFISRDLVSALHACIARHETPYRIGDGHNLYDFISIQNVADAHILAVRNLLSDAKTAAGRAFFISNDEPIYFRDLMLATWAHFGHVPAFEVGIPTWLASSVGLACEWLTRVTGIEQSLSRGSVLDAIGVRYADITLAKDVLGYLPRVSTAEGLREACEGYKALIDNADTET